MLDKDSFKNPRLWLEQHNKKNLAAPIQDQKPRMPNELWMSCPACNNVIISEEYTQNLYVCPKCDHHGRLSARQRIQMIADNDSFQELFTDLESENILDFPEYEEKLARAMEASGEKESVICGSCEIGGVSAVLCVMEGSFMMGSMGTVTGEKITLAFEYATRMGLPVVVFTISGGARMQEGVLSLMQMAKTSGAVKLHSDKGLFYLTVLANPTTGGVTASFAMEGDIIVSEPGALIGFAGPRVIAQTIRQDLPAGFQSAEFLLDKGFLDDIVHRQDLKEYLSKVLYIHSADSSFWKTK